MCLNFDCCVFIWCILCPPVAVLIRRGCNGHLWLNLCLTCFLPYFGGIVHAFYVCFFMDKGYRGPANVTVVHNTYAQSVPMVPAQPQVVIVQSPVVAAQPAVVPVYVHQPTAPAYPSLVRV